MENLLIQTLLFLLPFHYVKHFYAPNAYVNGILVDYLIPKLWVVDILLAILLISWVSKYYKNLLIFIWVLFSTLLFAHAFIHKLPFSSYIYTFRLILYILFAFYVAFYLLKKKDFFFVFKPLLYSTVIEVFIVLAQWFKQSSIAHYWLLGEFPFSSSTLRVATVNFFGALKVIPYGTFPHPNALAGFLSLLVLWTLYYYWKKRSFYLLLFSGLFSLGLFFTFSQSAWLVTFISISVFILSYWLISIYPNSKSFLFSSVLGTFILFAKNSLSFVRRVELNKYSLKILADNPLFGVGLNNFTRILPFYGRISGPCAFIQPVHNIYLLIFAEAGVFLGLIFLFLLFFSLYVSLKDYLTTKNSNSLLFFVSLLHVMLLGLFDHYFLTLLQTMLLFWLTIGLALSRLDISIYGSKPA